MKSEGHLQAYSPIQPYALGCTRDEILMILLPLLCLLAGAGLGYYFQVYVLIPAAPLALMAVVGDGFASDVGPWWILLDASVAALALQIGYIAGSILHARTASPATVRLKKQCGEVCPDRGTSAPPLSARQMDRRVTGIGYR